MRVGDDAWLDCDPGLGAQLAASLNRFRIRVKVEIVDRSDEFGMLSFIGVRRRRRPTSLAGVRVGFRPGGATT